MILSGRSLLREWGLLFLFLSAFLGASQHWGWLARGDFWAYDLTVPFQARLDSQHEPSPDDPVIIAIDEESLAWGGRWPWSRRLLAQAVDRLSEAGSGPVLLDIILAEGEADDPGADTALADALVRHRRLAGGVVLPVFSPTSNGVQEDSSVAAVLPQSSFRPSVQLGHAHALMDGDGISRRLWPQESLGAYRYNHVAWELLGITPDFVSDPVLVPFAGPPGYFRRFSLSALLQGNVPVQALKGHRILIGATATGLGDTLATPLAGQGGAMSGVEFVANMVYGLKTGSLAHPLGEGPSLLLSQVLLLALMLLLLLAPPRWSLLVTFLAATLVLAGAWAGLFFLDLWWPPASLLATVILAYPLWSWRRLEAGLSAMERETRRMADLAPSAPVAPLPTTGLLDPVENRIKAIGRAVDRIAAALIVVGDPAEERRHREEMLRHLAHDLRSPLISLRGLADELREQGRSWGDPVEKPGRSNPLERIDQCARRALDLSEQFILLGRANSLDPKDHGEVDLVDLLHRSADDLWEDARRQGSPIQRDCQLVGAWVRGDARLLQRALMNLGWNALRHGPAKSTITLRLEAQDGALRLGVHDQGTGFAEEDLATLVASWRQGENSDRRGHGLGLAFVQQVMDSHGATLLASPASDGFTLWLCFPEGSIFTAADIV